MKKGNYPIPFDKHGNQQHYPETWRVNDIDWRDNEVFCDTLTFQCYRRGRSAAYFEFARTDGRKVTMFLKDFENVVPQMVKGTVSGCFTFTKRGQNFGVQFSA